MRLPPHGLAKDDVRGVARAAHHLAELVPAVTRGRTDERGTDYATLE